MFADLEQINHRPKPFECYTAADLWTDEHTAKQMLDVYSLKAYEQREEGASYAENLLDGFWSPDKYYGFLNTFKYDEEKVVLDKYTIVEADRSRTVYNWLQYFSPEDLEQEFNRAGLVVRSRLADVAGTDYREDDLEFAVIAGRQP